MPDCCNKTVLKNNQVAMLAEAFHQNYCTVIVIRNLSGSKLIG